MVSREDMDESALRLCEKFPRNMYLHSFLDYWAREQPNAEFAIQDSQQLTYLEALIAANRLANALISMGLQVGDRIAILSRNRIEYVLLYFAASKAGVVPVPLNYRLVPLQWAYIINDARVRALMTGEEYVDSIDAIRKDLKTVERFVAFRATNKSGWEKYHQWITHQPDTAPPISIQEDADVYQMYTSGTTGHPKGALLTHRTVTANVMQNSFIGKGTPGERSLVVLPLFHAATVPTTFSPVSWGGSLYIMEGFDPTQVVRVLSEERIGFATLVPTMIQACLLSVPGIASRYYEHLRVIYYGASPISEQTLRCAMQVFPCEFLQTYGLTEATQAVTFLSPADHRRALSEKPELLLSAGRPVVGTELRIVDGYDNPVSNGTVGEIVVRGPQLMRGYWNRPDETAQTLRGGWLHTGDAGMLDDEGYLYIRDRVKDVIISGGENVYPTGIERVLCMHPAIAEAAVIGVPDERWGEVVKAVVVLCKGATATEEEIIDFCRNKLAGFERPRSVDFVDALPRNPSGKVLKRVLREPYWLGQSRRVAGA
jgi:acyl-CoA synthetase (AMP-forming)/AMP-acid ligase II